MNSKSIKLTFLLSDKQAGPFPVSTESLWCDCEKGNYRVKNIPFFIDNLSFDDLISVTEVSEGLFEIQTIVEFSRNSTIWIYLKDEINGKAIIDELLNIGCGVESGVIEGYFSINVPATININNVCSIIKDGKENQYILSDYPSIRHECKQTL